MTTLVQELEQAALRNETSCRLFRSKLGKLADVNCDCPVGTEARRLRARAARVREMEETVRRNLAEGHPDFGREEELMRRLTGPDLGPTRRGEPA